MNRSIDYPYCRDSQIPSSILHKYPTIEENWKYSAELIACLRDRLGKGGALPEAIHTITAAGSLARMEASAQSDADLLIVVREGTSVEAAEEAYKAVWNLVLDVVQGDPKPNREGVFSMPVHIESFHPHRMGARDETLADIAHRVLLMLESQPLYGDDQYRGLMSSLMNQYTVNYTGSDGTKEWVLLMNDLSRYFRSICLNYEHTFRTQTSKWPLRNVKLRHSRILMYAGLMFVLGEASKERSNKPEGLWERLRLTPLERVQHVYTGNNDWNVHRVLGPYELFLRRLGETAVRSELTGDKIPYQQRYSNPTYRDLKVNSDALAAELTRFVLARRHSWSERFFEYLLF